jgi:hypothetical protein
MSDILKKACLLALSVGIGGSAFAQQSSAIFDLPPDAGPGRCFSRVSLADTQSLVVEDVIDVPGRVEKREIAAKYVEVEEEVVVIEASKSFRTIPATYKTVTETVIVEPARTESRLVPAVTENYEEKVLVRPAYTTWKKGSGVFGRVYSEEGALPQTGVSTIMSTGELLCLVEVPAEYTTVKRVREVSPARTETVSIPAETATVTRQVIDQPARFEEEVIPAVVNKVKVRKLVAPARIEEVQIPATYRKVQRVVQSDRSQGVWREVLCNSNGTPEHIKMVQAGLAQEGYYTGPIDGVFTSSVDQAMEAFQRAKGLATGYLTMETFTALGGKF